MLLSDPCETGVGALPGACLASAVMCTMGRQCRFLLPGFNGSMFWVFPPFGSTGVWIWPYACQAGAQPLEPHSQSFLL
jgi:hypothetical protein